MLLSMVIWGGTWPAGKVAVEGTETATGVAVEGTETATGVAVQGTETATGVAPVATPPELIVFWRFLITALAFAPALAARRLAPAPGTLRRIPARSWLFALGAAAALVVYNELFFWGLRLGLASAGGIVVPTLSALATFLVSAAVGRRTPRALPLLGVALGLAGGMMILRVWRLDLADLSRSGNLFFVAAALAWTAVTICSQRAQEGAGFVPVSLAIYAGAAVFAIPMALSAGGLRPPPAASFWLLVAYLAVAATAFATTVYFLAASRLGSEHASSFMFVVPLGAVLLSWLLLGERPDPLTLAGGALSIGAVYLVNSGRRPRSRATG
jgi:drug/metabolite transporter (DMT)-like permease